MECERCKGKMKWGIKGATQGWECPACGWNIITTYIDEIKADETEYSLYIRNISEINMEKIKFIAKTANVNFNIAKYMLKEKEVCILKSRALEIKSTIAKLKELNIEFSVSPLFKY